MQMTKRTWKLQGNEFAQNFEIKKEERQIPFQKQAQGIWGDEESAGISLQVKLALVWAGAWPEDEFYNFTLWLQHITLGHVSPAGWKDKSQKVSNNLYRIIEP